MRAASYLRQSEDRTGEEWGVERQRDDVTRYINARGWTPVEEFVDNDISAYSGKPRAAFNRMMHAVEHGDIDLQLSDEPQIQHLRE